MAAPVAELMVAARRAEQFAADFPEVSLCSFQHCRHAVI
jgi:hypothetical protein